MTWSRLATLLDQCATPGLPRERYAQALRTVTALHEHFPDDALARCVVFMACVRLGEAERALALLHDIRVEGHWTVLEDLRCAGHALALHQLARREEAATWLARLRELAADAAAAPRTISLCREVEAVLR